MLRQDHAKDIEAHTSGGIVVDANPLELHVAVTAVPVNHRKTMSKDSPTTRICIEN